MKKPFQRFLYKNLFFLSVFCLPIYATDYLRVPDMRSIGMGGNCVTQSVYFNPALVAEKSYRSVHIGYFNRYTIKELNTLYAGFGYYNSILPVGFDLFSFGYADYKANMFRLSIAKQLHKKWKLGVAFQSVFLHSLLYKETPKILSTDIGILYFPVNKLLIGVSVTHFPSFFISGKTIDIKGLTTVP